MNAKQLIRLFAELHIDVEKYTTLANDTVASRLDGKDLAYLRRIRSELYTVTDPIPEHGEEPKEKKGILARLKEMLG